MYTEEEKAEKAKQPPPEDPRITAANIQAKARIDAAKMTTDASVERQKLDTDRDTAFQNSLNERARIDADANAKELELRRELEIYKENNSIKKELEKIKAELAQTTMKLRVQQEESRMALAADKHVASHAGEVIAAPVEPAGRAPDGQAFAR